ncbi:MAG: hypothetical protein AVDCRST_MAG49-3800, partial [uncultured Thermomicrobiales bacterium]
GASPRSRWERCSPGSWRLSPVSRGSGGAGWDGPGGRRRAPRCDLAGTWGGGRHRHGAAAEPGV